MQPGQTFGGLQSHWKRGGSVHCHKIRLAILGVVKKRKGIYQEEENAVNANTDQNAEILLHWQSDKGPQSRHCNEPQRGRNQLRDGGGSGKISNQIKNKTFNAKWFFSAKMHKDIPEEL